MRLTSTYAAILACALVIGPMAMAANPPKLPPPSAAAMSKAEKLVRQIYTDDGNHAPAARKALAEKMMAAAALEADPASQFVLYNDARNIAMTAGELELALKAIDELDRRFVLNVADLRNQTINAAEQTGTPEPEIATSCLAVSRTAWDAGDFATAAFFAARAEASARKAKSLQLTAEASAVAKDAHNVDTAFRVLAKNPTDRHASSVFGSYLCFTRNQWTEGLKLLASGSDAALSALAARDIKADPDANSRFELANSWWDFAQRQPWQNKANIEKHAAAIYQLALPGLSGLPKSLAEKRAVSAPAAVASQPAAPASQPVVQAPAPPTPTPAATPTPPVTSAKPSPLTPSVARGIDLMPLFDVRNPVSGTWQFVGHDLHGADKKSARVQSSYRPPAEYDYVVEFARPEANGAMVQMFFHEGHAGGWYVGSNGNTFCLEDIDGKARNKTRKPLPKGVIDNARHVSILQVRNDRIKAFVDGELLLEYETDYHELTPNTAAKMSDDRLLGLAAIGGPVIIFRAVVIEIAPSGAGAKPSPGGNIFGEPGKK